MDSDCVLSADYDGCYYVSPAYSRTDSSTNNRCTGSSAGGDSDDRRTVSHAGGDSDDRCRLVALINKFNTNNHGLIMTLVSSGSSH